VALANGSDYGLTASIQSADTARATAVANRLKSGGGASDFDAYTQCQWTTVTAG
jgi:hypothetical protein